MKSKLLAVMSIAASTALLSGCSLGQFSFTGTMSVPTMSTNVDGYGPSGPGETCFFGEDGQSYPDIDAGSQVVLKDSTGKSIAVSSLGQGGLLFGWDAGGSRVYSSSDTFMHDLCSYEFTFEGVQSGDNIFSIEIGSRGDVVFSKEELLEGPALSLGNFGD
jgi:hypothetical protein